MAKQRVIQLIDDLDQGSADETIRFAIDEQVYEIDLSHKHAAELRAVLARYREHGRRISRVRLLAAGERPGPRRNPAAASRNAHIRAWAAQHDYRVQPQGRIPNEVIKLYEAAQGANA